ncbi:MAG: hypothetical protein ACYS8Z_26645 [Planctomycetota bacterium]|jgi:hypothetical protein
MGIILRNLKAGLSRWGVWWNVALMGLFILVFVRPAFRERGPFAEVIIPASFFPLAFGLMWLSHQVVHTQREAAGKPFSFCLPGYRESLRKLNVTGAALSGMGFGLMFTAYAWLLVEGALFEIILRAAGGFCVGITCILASGNTLRFSLSRLGWGIIMLLSPALFVGGVLAIFYAFEHAIAWYPLIPLSLVFSVLVLRGLGDMERLRCGHRMIVEDAMEARVLAGYKKTVSPCVEDLFVRCMERAKAGRHIPGGLYRTFGEILSHWLWIVVSIVVGALLLCYTNKWMAELAFVVIGAAAFRIDLPVRSDILFPEGRRERYRASIAVAIGASLLLVAAAAGVTALSWLYAMFMPEMKGHPCEAIPFGLVYLPCVLAPGFFALQLLGLKAQAIAVIHVVAITVVFAGSVINLNLEGCTWPEYTRGVLFSSVFFGGWIAFLLTSRLVCSRWSLSKQGIR